MYFENCETVFPIKRQTTVVSSSEIGMVGPALRAMIGNANTTLVAGAIWVTPWNTSAGRPSALRRSWGCAVRLVGSAVTRDLSYCHVAPDVPTNDLQVHNRRSEAKGVVMSGLKSAYGLKPATHDAELTEVRRGTPMGELLRRYWHPV